MLNNPANGFCTDLQKERKIAKGQKQRVELWQLPTSLEFSLQSDQGTVIKLPQPRYECHLAVRGKARMVVAPKASN